MIRYTHGGSGETVQWIAIAIVFEPAGNSADGTVQNETAQSFFWVDSRDIAGQACPQCHGLNCLTLLNFWRLKDR